MASPLAGLSSPLVATAGNGEVALLRRLCQGLASQQAVIQASTKHAAVAMILRLRWPSDLPSQPISVSRVLDGDYETARVEMLYVKRTARVGDDWSGNVAFPGGKEEPADVDIRATAVRETLEESGIDLDSGDFEYLGRLDDRPVVGGGGKIPGFFCAPLVWLQTSATTPPITLQSSELAAWRWAPLSMLTPAALTFELVHISVTCQRIMQATCLSARIARSLPCAACSFGDVHFMALDLQVDGPGAAMTSDVSVPFHLWGMTLAMTSDALVSAGCPPLELAGSPRFRLSCCRK